MFSHQLCNSIGNDLYNCYWYKNLQWDLHYHRGYEFVWVTAGKLCAHVAGQDYILHEGDALFITPYQLHSYKPDGYSEIYITVFSGSFVGKFVSSTSDTEPISAKFSVSEPLAVYLRAHMAKSEISKDRMQVLIEKPPYYFIKACLYAICAEFYSVAKWREKAQNNELVFRIIKYIEENYTDDITLQTLSDELSYEYHYISRVLRESLHVRFRTLVNQYRCERAKEMITETNAPLSVIAMNCGFQSIRNFNRVFFDIAGVTPSDLRKAIKK